MLSARIWSSHPHGLQVGYGYKLCTIRVLFLEATELEYGFFGVSDWGVLAVLYSRVGLAGHDLESCVRSLGRSVEKSFLLQRGEIQDIKT